MEDTPETVESSVGGGLRGAVVAHVTSQFHRPRGLLGRVAGRIMAKRGSNVDRNLWLIDLLELGPEHRVLEIGPGPGVALEAAGRTVTAGHLSALDHSAVMLRQTARRNRGLIDDGRLTLIEGRAEQLPAGLGPFDRIYAMNVWHFWPDQEAMLSVLAERLAPGGRLAMGYQPRHPGADLADMHAGRRCLIDQLKGAGLVNINDHINHLNPPVTAVIGTMS